MKCIVLKIMICCEQAGIHPSFHSRTSNRVNEFKNIQKALCIVCTKLHLYTLLDSSSYISTLLDLPLTCFCSSFPS